MSKRKKELLEKVVKADSERLRAIMALERVEAEADGWKSIALAMLEVAMPGLDRERVPPVELIPAAVGEFRPNVDLFWNTVMAQREQLALVTGQPGHYQRLLVEHKFIYNPGGPRGRGSMWILRFGMTDGSILEVRAEEVTRDRMVHPDCRCGGRSGMWECSVCRQTYGGDGYCTMCERMDTDGHVRNVRLQPRFVAGHDTTAGCPVHSKNGPGRAGVR